MRYHGQAFELLVPWPDPHGPLAPLLDAFHDLHAQRFSYANPADPVEIVTVRLTASGLLPALPPALPAAAGGPGSGTPDGVRRRSLGGRAGGAAGQRHGGRWPGR